jgi:hypothetical protein
MEMRNEIGSHDFDGTGSPGEQPSQSSAWQYLANLVRAARPPQVCGGPDYSTPNGVKWARTAEDSDLLAKTVSVRSKDEKLIELMARTGISLHQLRTLTMQEIERFVRTVQDNGNDPYIPQTFTAPEVKKRPAKLYLDTWS